MIKIFVLYYLDLIIIFSGGKKEMRTKTNTMMGTMKRVLSLVLAFLIVFTLSAPVNASAKTKSIKLKNSTFTTSATVAASKAKTVKKGTYKVTLKKKGYNYSGYMKFTAPTTKTYSFTISNVRSNTGRYVCGFGYVMRNSGYADNIGQVAVSTKGGSQSAMQFASKGSSVGYITKRTGKITLNQGETVYLYLSAASSLSKSVSLKYTIK